MSSNDNNNNQPKPKMIPLEEGWEEIKVKGIDRVEEMLHSGGGGMMKARKRAKLFEPKEYIGIYTTCYDMCTQRSPDNWTPELYQRHGEAMEQYLTRTVLPALRDAMGQGGTTTTTRLLVELQYQWSNFKILNKWLQKFFTYLDRFYVKNWQIPTLSEAGLRCFRNHIFDAVKWDTTAAMLDLIHKEREGKIIDTSLIESIVELYETMGRGCLQDYNLDPDGRIRPPAKTARAVLTEERKRVADYLNSSTESQFQNMSKEEILEKINNDERHNKLIHNSMVKSIVGLYGYLGMGSLDAYHFDLEVPLLDATREYYARKREEWINDNNTGDYLIQAEAALMQERNRVASYLNSSTESKLLKVVDEEILEKAEMILLENESSGFRALLKNDRSEDLQRMLRLFQRVDNGLLPMAQLVDDFFSSIGEDIISSRRQADGKETYEDPEFVQSLLDLHKRYLFLFQDFSGYPVFKIAFDRAFVKIVNKQVGQSSNAELLSGFCDCFLKKGSDKLSKTDVEERMDGILDIFPYLTDKDIFAEIYRNQLAKRLLNQRSISEDAEKGMITKFKVQCGMQFTSKMEKMLDDLAVSVTQRSEFDQRIRQQVGTKLEFSVQVLTTGVWPTYRSPEVTLTEEMIQCMSIFDGWFKQKHQSRRLQWVFTQGSATVLGMFGKKSYHFQVSTLQAIAMQALNNGVILSFKELQQRLNLEEGILKPLMHSLSCGKFKVITKSPASNTVKVTDTFTANAKFSSKLRKMRIRMASLDPSFSTKKVEEDRSFAIDASIVRIMKARKTIQHHQLLSEVIAQLSFFSPTPRAVKKRIEALIDLEYLEHSGDNRDFYSYLA